MIVRKRLLYRFCSENKRSIISISAANIRKVFGTAK